MICSFSCRESEKIWNGYFSKKFPSDIQARALRKLRQLDAALILEDLKHPPGNRLEALKGDRDDEMSIRINQRWRICFVWDSGKAHNVHIINYH